MKLRIALAQVNPTVGDLAANAALVRQNVAAAQSAGHQRAGTRESRAGAGQGRVRVRGTDVGADPF